MEEENLQPSVSELLLKMLPEDVSVACTRYIGHCSDAKAVVLGRETLLVKE